MTPFEQISQAAIGWGEIVMGRETARERFRLDADGGLVALGLYGLVIAVVIALQMAQFPNQPIFALVVGAAFNLVPVFGLALVTLPTYWLLRRQGNPYELLVPGIYLLGGMLALGVALSYFDAQVGTAILGVTAFLLFRTARTIGGFGIGSALAYAVLTALVLVALPFSLYMLIAPGPGPI